MKAIRRVDLNAAIERTIGMLADADFMLGVLKVAISLQRATPEPARVERERALAKLAKGRAELLKALRGGASPAAGSGPRWKSWSGKSEHSKPSFRHQFQSSIPRTYRI
jgi:hypothetical protein